MANPTTNYGFVLPTATDLVTDLPADFDVALQGVDTRLKALQPGTTLGDIAYSSATANTNTRLAVGSTGNVLTVSGGVPIWAAPASGGKILQVVQATYSTPTTTTSTSYVDSGLTVSITPSSASSKILCIVSHHFRIGNAGSKSRGFVQLVRDSTAIWTSTSTDYLTTTSGGSYAEFGWGYTFSYLDSPATTSATTYKTQQRCYAGNVDSPSVTSHAGQSGIIVMEVGA